MTTPRQIAANRQNALKSTGPKTALGKAKAARNALRHGLFAIPAIIPELGESADDWFTFAARVVRYFDTVGVVERQLAYRAAQLMWRLGRVDRADAAVIAAVVAAALPPDPATVGPEKSSHMSGPLPPDAPVQQRLARHRAGLRSTRSNLEDIRATAGRVRALPGLPDAENVGGYSLVLVGAVERATGLDPEVARSGLVVIRQGLELKDATFLPAGWTAGVTRVVFRILAGGLGVRPDEFAGRVAAELDREAVEVEGRLAEAEVREAQLVELLTAERERAGAASVLSAGPSLETLIRVEAHLTRQLEVTLRQLARLQAGRGQAAGGVAAVFAGLAGLAGEPGGGAQRKNGFVPQSLPAGLDVER